MPWFSRLFGINSCVIAIFIVNISFDLDILKYKRIYIYSKKDFCKSFMFFVYKRIYFIFSVWCILIKSDFRLVRAINSFFLNDCALFERWAEGTNLDDPISPEGTSRGTIFRWSLGRILRNNQSESLRGPGHRLTYLLRFDNIPLVRMERRGAKRRSTSLGDGDILSSTIDMPEASSTNRFSNFNNERCVSTPILM